MSETGGIAGGSVMGWQEYYQRRDALDRVVAEGRLSVPDGFTDESEVLLALQYRWSLQLTGRLEMAVHTGGDLVDGVRHAWLSAASANPPLRRLLDEHLGHPALRSSVLRQQALLARAAGLVEPQDTLPPNPASPTLPHRESNPPAPRVQRSRTAS